MAKYTAEDLRKVADNLDSVYVAPECEDKKEQYGYLSMASMMLRQSADILGGILNEMTIIEKMPTAALDGAFENQKINGERLMAKISFYDKVKEIVGEVHNV